MKNDKGNKISHDEATGKEVDITTSSKRIKGNTKDQEIVDLYLEGSINQEEIGKGVMIQQENPKQETTSSSEQTISQFVLKIHLSSIVLDIHSYQYVEASATQNKKAYRKRNMN